MWYNLVIYRVKIRYCSWNTLLLKYAIVITRAGRQRVACEAGGTFCFDAIKRSDWPRSPKWGMGRVSEVPPAQIALHFPCSKRIFCTQSTENSHWLKAFKTVTTCHHSPRRKNENGSKNRSRNDFKTRTEACCAVLSLMEKKNVLYGAPIVSKFSFFISHQLLVQDVYAKNMPDPKFP